MARSMTAYGKAYFETDSGLFLIEIHSVNRKYLDITINLPKDFLMFDNGLRKCIAQTVKRGSVTVRLTRECKEKASVLIPPIEQLKQVYATCKKCAVDLGYGLEEPIPLTFLLNFASTAPVLEKPIGEEFGEKLYKGLDHALQELIRTKETEGLALIQDIISHLDSIVEEIEKIERAAKDEPKYYREKLTKRLEELNLFENETLMRELVIFSDKIDVTEEVVRLRFFAGQFREKLGQEKIRLGRELDFLSQEMHRETSTIGAKSQELKVIQSVVVIKSELEKMREQLQNIE